MPRAPRILVVEDIALIAFDVAHMLQELRLELAGLALTLPEATRLADALEIDAALLDADLCGKDTGPVAAVLERRGIPFVFATALDRRDLPAGYQDRPRISKPFTPAQIGNVLGIVLHARQRDAAAMRTSEGELRAA